MTWKSKVSPVIFLASILAFVLPFVTVSCGGQKVASLSGVQLATGTTVQQPQVFGPPQKQRVEPDPAAALAALCAILGLVLSFLSIKNAIAPAIAGAMGALSLLFMKVRLDDQVVKQGHGMLQVSYEGGFVLTLMLLIAGAAWNAYLLSQRRPAPPATQFATEKEIDIGRNPEVQSQSTAPAYCPHCGQPWTSGAKFCMQCGKPAGDSAAARG